MSDTLGLVRPYIGNGFLGAILSSFWEPVFCFPLSTASGRKDRIMKLYLYNGLDENGKATYQRIEIDGADADRWVQIDYEKRKLEEGDDASPRTA